MVVNGTTVSQVPNVAGQVLATSPDGTLAIYSDTSDSPNRVFICQSCSSASQNIATFLFDGATAAAFSPDNIAGGFKAYIVSGKPCPGTSSLGCLLVFSKVDAAKIVQLSAPATDVTFIGNGTLGYIASPDPSGAVFLPTCDDPSGSAPGSISPSLPGQFIRALPDGQSAIALNAPPLNAPTLQSVIATISGTPPVGVPGCPAPRGFLTINNTVAPAASLGIGSFTPTQFFLSPDGSTAYVLGQATSGTATARLPFIIAFNLSTQLPSDISLTGNAVPLSASISPAGDLLFVGADDGAVHVINTTTQLDTQQVTFPFPQSSLCLGPGNPATQPPVTCNPDLVAVKP
jgi:WD40 repeat protein